MADVAPLRKLILTPYFGKFPEWFHKFEPPVGYDWLLDVNFNGFKQRVRERLNIDYPGEFGGAKVWDYRCALGLLYSRELQGYDYWATMDFDMCFGDVDKWFPDSEIRQLDVWSNHDTYVCGPWTLYKNSGRVNTLFMDHPDWLKILEAPQVSGWVEDGYSRVLEQSGLKYRYSFHQGDPYHPPFNLKKIDGRLFQDGTEIPMLHFRREKTWPL